jgi:hypothetical protein
MTGHGSGEPPRSECASHLPGEATVAATRRSKATASTSGTIKRACPQCRASMRPQAHTGATVRTIHYRNLRSMPLPDSVAIMLCRRCRYWCIAPENRTASVSLLNKEYRHILRQRVKIAIDNICRFKSKRQLELLLGLSQGYLSRLHAGAGNPSPELVSNLALLANDPQTRLKELEVYWAQATERVGP